MLVDLSDCYREVPSYGGVAAKQTGWVRLQPPAALGKSSIKTFIHFKFDVGQSHTLLLGLISKCFLGGLLNRY